ncbi:MAG: hypothetical protein ACLUSP_05235 [Christensenellales bacterium]
MASRHGQVGWRGYVADVLPEIARYGYAFARNDKAVRVYAWLAAGEGARPTETLPIVAVVPR